MRLTKESFQQLTEHDKKQVLEMLYFQKLLPKQERRENMKLTCIKDVIMDTGEKAFSEGEEYKGRQSTSKENYDVFQVIRATNNQGKSHIIKYIGVNRLDAFFQKHFVENVR